MISAQQCISGSSAVVFAVMRCRFAAIQLGHGGRKLHILIYIGIRNWVLKPNVFSVCKCVDCMAALNSEGKKYMFCTV